MHNMASSYRKLFIIARPFTARTPFAREWK